MELLNTYTQVWLIYVINTNSRPLARLRITRESKVIIHDILNSNIY
jgi:hypothetical protein